MVVDEQEEIKELLELTRENNKILRGMRRRQHWHTLFVVLYWLVLGGIAVATYTYLEPYLRSLIETYGAIQDGVSRISTF